jgi:hypothetical protein
VSERFLFTLLVLGALPSAAGGAERSRPVDFESDVIPVLTRSGCNAGACHGGAAGRGGFKLSLFGADPAADYDAIVREREGRRVDLARPEESLVLEKPAGYLEHGGGLRLDPDGPGYALLRRWIESGARRLRLHRLESFAVTPSLHVAGAPGERVALRASAVFDDGSTEDVTRWTVFTPDDPGAVTVRDVRGDGGAGAGSSGGGGADSGVGAEDGDDARLRTEAVVGRRGQSVIVARYLSKVAPVRILVPVGEPAAGGARRPALEASHPVDRHVLETLRTLRLEPRPPADDAVFLRRARLVLTGRLPSAAEAREFIASAEPGKRARLIDRLVDSEDFTGYWTFRLASLLRIRSLPNDAAVAAAFHRWVRDAVRARMPYDALARALLTATGDSHERGAAAFHRMASGARDEAELVSQVFLGARLRCANCHDHPLDRWTQDDYHGLAAVFARLERGRIVERVARGEVTHPRTGEAAAPRLPGDRFLAPDEEPLAALAAWTASAANPAFARAIVNRLWSALMGRGLVEPVDDLRATNPPTHPELLDFLARDLAESGFDLRHTIRRIATSETFARAAAEPGVGYRDDRFYSAAIVRPLAAEVLADAVSDVTGVGDLYPGHAPGTRAVELPDPKVPAPSLDILGRCAREAPCEEGARERGLARHLHLLNGPFLNEKVASDEGIVARRLEEGRGDDEIIEELYLRALGRFPRAEERAFWARRLGPQGTPRSERRAALEDFLWSLLACSEFTTIH